MATVFGMDRVEPLPNGGRRLRSRAAKPWGSRREKTATDVEHPGTAVLWDGEHWEVLAVEEAADGFRYDLAPWNDRHAIRRHLAYDAATEAAHAAEVRDASRRTRSYWRAVLLAPLTGLLPAREQERLEIQAGVPSARLTVISTIPWMMLGGLCLLMLFAFIVGGGYGARPVGASSIPLLFLGLFLMIEAMFRLGIALSQNRPVGSILGVLPWLVVHAARRTPLEVRPGHGVVRDTEAEDAHEMLDAYSLREPWLAFLSPPEQERLRAHFGFDVRLWGKRSAWFVIACCVPLGMTAISRLREDFFVFDLGVLALVGTLAVEQAGRLRELSAGRPAGSRLLAPLVRAASRKLLAA